MATSAAPSSVHSSDPSPSKRVKAPACLSNTLLGKLMQASGREVDIDSFLRGCKYAGIRANHDLHPYPGKLLPQLARSIIRSLPDKGGVVGDPFCGSGTVLVEASLAGFHTAGCDTNPFARLLSRVKIRQISPAAITRAAERVTRDLRAECNWKKCIPSKGIDFNFWYYRPTLVGLAKLLARINRIKNLAIREFLFVSFAALANKTSLCDPRITVPVRINSSKCYGRWQGDIDKKVEIGRRPQLAVAFRGITERNLQRMRAMGDDMARDSSLASDCLLLPKVDHIVTSPPYFCSQKYIRSSSLAITWLDMIEGERLADMESKVIGRERIKKSAPSNYIFAGLPECIKVICDHAKNANADRHELLMDYISRLSKAFSHMQSALKTSGLLTVIVGSGSLCGKSIPTVPFYEWILKRSGFEICGIGVNTIRSRGLLTARAGGAGAIDKEYVIVCQKADR